MKDNIQGTYINGKNVFIILTKEYKGSPTMVEGAGDSVFIYDSEPKENLINFQGGNIEFSNQDKKISILENTSPDSSITFTISPNAPLTFSNEELKTVMCGENSDLSKEEI